MPDNTEKKTFPQKVMDKITSVRKRLTRQAAKSLVKKGTKTGKGLFKSGLKKLLHLGWLALMGGLLILALALLTVGIMTAIGLPYLIPVAGPWLMFAMTFLGAIFGYANVVSAVSFAFLGAGILTFTIVGYFSIIQPRINKFFESNAPTFIVRIAINLGLALLGFLTITLGVVIGVGAAASIPGVGALIAGALTFVGSLGLGLQSVTFITSAVLLSVGLIELAVSGFDMFIKPRISKSTEQAKEYTEVNRQTEVIKENFRPVPPRNQVDLDTDLVKSSDHMPLNPIK